MPDTNEKLLKVRLMTAPIILWCVAATALVLSFYDTIIPSPVWWFASATCGVLAIWLSSRKDEHIERAKQRRDNCKAALEVIKKQMNNFQQITDAQATGKTFSGLHQRAVEEYSFELTLKAIAPIAKHWRYRTLCRSAKKELVANMGRELQNMQVLKLSKVLKSLEDRLTKECAPNSTEAN